MSAMSSDQTQKAPSESIDEGYWGYHLILDCNGCDIPSICDENTLRAFVKTLVEEIDMKAYGEPLLANFATHHPTAASYSLVQLIETSSITAHFAENSGEAYIDVFSCKTIEIGKALAIVRKYFKPASIKVHFLTRQA
jgi:S-adenosylmethionine/arginine decarboxylase-like enzyme